MIFIFFVNFFGNFKSVGGRACYSARITRTLPAGIEPAERHTFAVFSAQNFNGRRKTAFYARQHRIVTVKSFKLSAHIRNCRFKRVRNDGGQNFAKRREVRSRLISRLYFTESRRNSVRLKIFEKLYGRAVISAACGKRFAFDLALEAHTRKQVVRAEVR